MLSLTRQQNFSHAIQPFLSSENAKKKKRADKEEDKDTFGRWLDDDGFFDDFMAASEKPNKTEEKKEKSPCDSK